VAEQIGEGRKPFTTQGKWWLPDSDNQVAGTLSYADGQIKLDLVGLLDGPPTWFDRKVIRSIFGMTSDGIEVTLCDSRQLGWQTAGTHQREHLIAGSVFIGAHLPLGTETKFEQVHYQFSGLTTWSILEPVTGSEMLGDRRVLRPMEFHSVTATVPIARISLGFGLSESSSVNHFILDRSSTVQAMLSRPMTGAEIFSSVTRPLQHFLTFVCDDPAHLLNLTYQSSEFNRVSNGVGWPQPITCIYSGETSHPDENQREYEMLLPLHEIADSADQLLERWFEIWGQVTAALDLLFGTMLGPETYTETRFLLLAQAAEAYSRLRFPDAQRMNVDQKARRTRVLEAIKVDANDHAWLKEALGYVHEPTFAEKLEGLIGHAGLEVNEKVRPGFTDAVKHTRNYYTHYDAKSKAKAVTDVSDLYRLAEEVIVLLQFCLMHDLGFESNEAWLAFRRTYRCRVLPDQTVAVAATQPPTIPVADQPAAPRVAEIVDLDSAIVEHEERPWWKRLLRRPHNR
jgi:hypothetical protein